MLVNFSRSEIIGFAHIPASTKKELAGNPVAAAITTWYLLEHVGDSINFVSDTYDDWPFPDGSPADLANYNDVTESTVESLVTAGVLRDDGRETYQDDPNSYMRILHNIWAD
jgi:hypothetical protein